jgi:Na+/alanine symporter
MSLAGEGTGNIAGVATALLEDGALWMWMVAFFEQVLL